MKHIYTLTVLEKRLVWEQAQLADWQAQSGMYAGRQVFLFEKHIADIRAAIRLLEGDQLI